MNDECRTKTQSNRGGLVLFILHSAFIVHHFRYNPPMAHRLIELIENLPASRVLLVGDMMIDHFLYGNAERLSPEAPVPVLHFQKQELRLGGAANVVANLATLGAKVAAIGVIGQDDN